MPSAADLRRDLPDWITAALPAYLPARRWFADKGRAIQGVRLLDCAWLPAPGGGGEEAPALALALAQVSLSGGAEATYQVPLAWRPQAPGAGAEILGTAHGWLAEGLSAPAFAPACLAALRAGRRLDGDHGVFVFRPSPRRNGQLPGLDALAAGSARLSRAEQSNSTLLYADAQGVTRLLFKCFRRVAAGVNPDAEITGYLTTHGAGHLVAPLAGTLEYQPRGGADAGQPEAWTLGIFQAFIANQGDGWEYVLRELAGAGGVPEPERDSRAGRLHPALEQLARCTAELHLALAGAPAGEPALAPEPIAAADWTAWRRAVADAAARLRPELARQAQTSALDLRLDRLPWPVFPSGLAKIRVHGDFHLGQTLWTGDGNWRLLDFEGEPARPLAERRQKLCVLKDVAGMLRSLDYAAGAAARAAGAAGPELPAWLERWRRQAREAFQSAYFSRLLAVPGAGPALVPAAARERAALLDFFELEKALYEAEYELRNRPGWLPLPLAGLRRLTAGARDPAAG